MLNTVCVMKVKKIISEVVNDLRALGVDDRISKRYVLTKLIEMNGIFLKRENDQLRLYNYANIFTTIDCLTMIESDIAECAGIRKQYRYMKSKNRIPELYTSANGEIVQAAMSLDDGNLYEPITLKEYIAIQSREFPSKKKYFWLRDGHVIIPEGPKMITFAGCFVDPSKARSISESYKQVCEEPLEEEFPCPEHLIGTVRQEAVKDLFNFYKRVTIDELPDGDTNIKSQSQIRNNAK